jgi:hypothetical protein
MMHKETNVGQDVRNLIDTWIADKFKWEAFFDPQSHSPDIERMSPVLDRVVVDSIDVVRDIMKNDDATWVHDNNDAFTDFINTDEFYNQGNI